MSLQKEIEALRRLPLLQRSLTRARELRRASPPKLRFPNRGKSVIAVHAEDAQMGLLPKHREPAPKFTLPRRP